GSILQSQMEGVSSDKRRLLQQTIQFHLTKPNGRRKQLEYGASFHLTKPNGRRGYMANKNAHELASIVPSYKAKWKASIVGEAVSEEHTFEVPSYKAKWKAQM